MTSPSSPDALEVAPRITAVRRRIAEAATAAGRDAAGVQLLLATKTLPAAVVRAAVAAGADLIGENRVQELLEHAPAMADLRPAIHLIGHLQSNKVNAALPWVACVETVDSAELAGRLSRRCAAVETSLDVMVQVNVSGEPTKSGVAPDDAARLAEDVATLPRLRLVGFMTIGANSPDAATVRRGYARLRQVRDDVVARGLHDAVGLSMGMSRDLELAVAEGATIVRVGTAVFGRRGGA